MIGLSANAPGSCERLWRLPSPLASQSTPKLAANVDSARSTLGQHTPVEQHIAGSNTSIVAI
jgi:hypothetical protein